MKCFNISTVIRMSMLGIFTLCGEMSALILDITQLKPNVSLQPVDPNTPYDKWVQIGTHNAYSCEDNLNPSYRYWPYAQQKLSVTDQIEKAGARTLFPDTYSVETGSVLGKKKRDICLCHVSCTLTKLFCAAKNPMGTAKDLVTLSVPQGQPFKEFLREMIGCLTRDPKLVLTLVIEDYVKDPAFFDQILEESGIVNYILKPIDWDVTVHKGWPTLGWLQQNNKRVLIFIDKDIYEGRSQYMRYQWYYIAENQYSTIDVNPGPGKDNVLAERGISADKGINYTRYLVQFNFFSDDFFKVPSPSIAAVQDSIKHFKRHTNYSIINGPELVNALNICAQTGLKSSSVPEQRWPKNRWPNIIALDYVEQGLAVAIANALNQYWSDTKDSQMFAPIERYTSTSARIKQ